jgi:hypothetical protein
VLADARADSADTNETDVRAVGGILYFALTGNWPHAEAGESALPDAMRDGSGSIAAPRQARAGIPAYLDDLTMDLLDKRIAAPESEMLAAELARLDTDADYVEDAGPLRFVTGGGGDGDSPRATKKIVVGVATLLLIAVVGLVFGIRAITASSAQNEQNAANPNNTGANQGPVPGQPAEPAQPQKIALGQDQVRIVDPPDGTRDDTGEAALTIDGKGDTGWETQRYNQPKFGNLKPGMGVLINLKEPRSVSDIRIQADTPGAVVAVLTGTGDPGDNRNGDQAISTTYKPVGENAPKQMSGSNDILSGFDPEQKYQYLLVWVTELPPADRGGFQLTLSEIEVWGT